MITEGLTIDVHGTVTLHDEFLTDTRRSHGRRMIHALIKGCPDCQLADAARARIRRSRALYGRRSR